MESPARSAIISFPSKLSLILGGTISMSVWTSSPSLSSCSPALNSDSTANIAERSSRTVKGPIPGPRTSVLARRLRYLSWTTEESISKPGLLFKTTSKPNLDDKSALKVLSRHPKCRNQKRAPRPLLSLHQRGSARGSLPASMAPRVPRRIVEAESVQWKKIIRSDRINKVAATE
jgi:hypothetical protein